EETKNDDRHGERVLAAPPQARLSTRHHGRDASELRPLGRSYQPPRTIDRQLGSALGSSAEERFANVLGSPIGGRARFRQVSGDLGSRNRDSALSTLGTGTLPCHALHLLTKGDSRAADHGRQAGHARRARPPDI